MACSTPEGITTNNAQRGRLTRRLEEEVQNGAFEEAVRVNRLDCGSIRCAVEAEAEGRDDADLLERALTRGVGLPVGRVYIHRRPEGGANVSLIAAREGFDFFGSERTLAEVSYK